MSGLRIVPLAAPLALVGAAAAVATWRLDRTAERPTLVLAIAAATVLTPLAASGRARDPIVPGGALAVFAALALLPGLVPLPTAAVSCVLVATLGLALADRARRHDWEGRDAALAIAGLVLSAQALASLDRIFVAPLGAATVARVTLLPAIVALALSAIARRSPPAALALGLATWSVAPGWSSGTAIVVAAGAAAFVVMKDAGRDRLAVSFLALTALSAWSGAAPPWLVATAVTLVVATAGAERSRLARPAAALLGAVALGAGLAGALPWKAPRPVERALSVLVAPPWRVTATPVVGRGRTVHAGRSRFEAPFASPGEATRRLEVGALEVTSYVTNSAGLACGTRIADVVLVEGRRETARFGILLGSESGEWAAARPDVAAAAACTAPPAHWSWIPVEGRFLGSTYRARLEPPAPVVADRVRFELADGLPEDVAFSVFAAVVER
jgi:hypothetical protein